MTVAAKALFGPATIGAAAAAIYTSPAGVTTTITALQVLNYTNGAVALTVWLVRAGDATENGNLIFGASAAGLNVVAGPADATPVKAAAGLVLAPGDAIWAQAGAATSINAWGSGWTQQ